ncbi:MAG: hypothetical protein WC401_10390 [Bacteroidales bacterium]
MKNKVKGNQCSRCYDGEYHSSCFQEVVADMEDYIDAYALEDDNKLTLDAQILKQKVWDEMTRLFKKLTQDNSSYTSNNFEVLEGLK